MITDFIFQVFTFQFFVEAQLIIDVVVFVRSHESAALHLDLLEHSLPFPGLLHPQPVAPCVSINAAPVNKKVH